MIIKQYQNVTKELKMQDNTQIPADIMCPISREMLEYPLICGDGFTYEKTFITKWIAKNKASPMMGSALDTEELRENRSLSAYVSVFKGLRMRLTRRKLHKRAAHPAIEQPTLPPPVRAKFDVALEHYYKSTLELGECCKLMAEVYDLAPDNFDAVMNYANILRFATQFDKAFGLIRRLKELRPGSLIPKYMSVRVMAESGKKEEATRLLMKILMNNRIEDHMLVEVRFMSYSLLSTINRDGAFRIVTTYLQVIPEDARALSHSIYINLLQENYKAVVQMSKRYLKIHPDDVSILFHEAKAYAKRDKRDKAIAIYDYIASIAIDKSVKSKALYESAVNKDCNKNFDKMVKELEESYCLDPREEADGYLAALYADRKMYDKAGEWLDVCAKRTNINDDQVYLGIRAQVEEHRQLFEQAIASYIRLAEIDSANSMYYNDRIEDIIIKQTAGAAKK